ncbi:MAG TPA: DinB family protein [Longimicrobiales bacterium]|nr:DinB family protein [Longimicrobiales bacterium]
METRHNILAWLLAGERSHADPARCFDALSPVLAGRAPAGAPYTVYEQLNHVRYWQGIYLRRLDGEAVPTPPTAAQGWPGPARPEGDAAWDAAVEDFRAGLRRALAIAHAAGLEEGLPNWDGMNRAHGLALLAAHNAYHAGQVVLLRRQLDAWPPPGVGDTW